MRLDPKFKAWTEAHARVLIESATEENVPAEQLYLALMTMAGVTLAHVRCRDIQARNDLSAHGHNQHQYAFEEAKHGRRAA